jgi:undecaprenyl-phosphate 4-deoxy-4-formamido-L-arabinose transferase
MLRHSVSVVIPIYKSLETLPELVSAVKRELRESDQIILVDDGNEHEIWDYVRSISSRQIIGLRLGKNFGQQSALLAGIRFATNDIIVTMDDDLQHDPRDIATLVNQISHDCDLVYGFRSERSRGYLQSFLSSLGRTITGWVALNKSIRQISAFRAFKRQLCNAFGHDLGPDVYLDALLYWATDRIQVHLVRHQPRQVGTSNYSLWKLAKVNLNLLMTYSAAPLMAATALGLTTVLMSVGVLAWVLIRPLIVGESVPGFPFLASTIAIFSGTQLIVLGILGQYIGRMHFRVMNKPTYTIAESTTQLVE